jgi:hypothetical protein
MAVNDIKEAGRSAADTIRKYIEDVAELRVETQTLVVGTDAAPQLAARTTLRLDGDNTTVLPVQAAATGKLEVDAALHELHMQHVRNAIEYRNKLLEVLGGLLRGR